MLEFVKGLLGLRLHPNGTMHLHDKALNPSSCISPCQVEAQLPPGLAATWPADIRQIELGGLNVGVLRNCSIDATVTYTPAGGVALAYTIWGS
jgi:hypothetical protein